MSSMTTTTEEDTELRDLVAATLENSGVLGKIKAQLRANVYIALEEGDNVKNKSKLVNTRLSDYLSTTNGRLVASLVREFLEFFDLHYTLAVFDPETNTGKDIKFRERSKLSEALGLTELTDAKAPLLSEIFRLSKVSVLKSESPTPSEVSDDGHTSAQLSLHEDEQTLNSRSEVSHEVKKRSSDISDDNSDSRTPEIVLKDSSLDLFRKPSAEKKLNPLGGDSGKSKDSFLSDLPPLGGVAKSSLSDLPPLTAGRSLAPLSKIPPKNIDSGLEPLAKKEASNKNNIKRDVEKSVSKPDTKAAKKMAENVPKFGFEPDHVISEKTDSFRKEVKKKSPDMSEEETDNIEEELDSFLNSEMSGGDITKDETVRDDLSLKADYVESL